MRNYQHILLASQVIKHPIEKLAKRTLEIKKEKNTRLSLLFIMETKIYFTFGFSSIKGIEEKLLKQAKYHLNELGDKLEIPENSRYLLNNPEQRNINKITQKINPDLIIIGDNKERNMFYHATTNPQSILSQTDRDMLVIPI